MNQYVTGTMIKRLREAHKMTQSALAEKLSVSDKTVSKWETGRGYPDISLVEPLAKALQVSVTELLAGENVTNENKSFHMEKLRVYVCPICGNVLFSTGDAVVSCCGIRLIPEEADMPDSQHALSVEVAEDEYYVTVSHEMTKEHCISFLMAGRDDGVEIRKLYPEGCAEARFKIARTRWIGFYCNRHGFFRVKVVRKRRG